MKSALPLLTLSSILLFSACTHTLQDRENKALSEEILCPGTLIVLPFENKTDGIYEDGFWFESVEKPASQLSGLTQEKLRKSGLFGEVKIQDQSLNELLKASGALKDLKQPIYILSGELRHFRSQMHAHWYAFLLPTSFLTPFGFPFPPAWGACDIRLQFRLTRWTAESTQSMSSDIEGHAYRSLFGATYWTESLLFRDMVDQASQQTTQTLAVAVKYSLFALENKLEKTVGRRKKADK